MNAKNNKSLLIILMTLITIFSVPAISTAQADSQSVSQDEFDKGVEYFNQGNYAAAVKALKKAEAQGMKSAALYYNLASSYYMLGEYDSARDYVNKVRKYKDMQYLAEYNLGLIALKQNDQQSAGKLFASVATNSEDNKLVFLAEKHLKEIAAQKKPQWVTKKWSAYISAALGYDDNVNFAPVGISVEASDSFSEIYATSDYLFSGDRQNGWLAEISFYDINFQTEDIYDEYQIGAAIKKYLQLGHDWQTIYSLDVSRIYYAGEDYQTIGRLSAEARNTFSKNEQLVLRYSYEDISSDNPLFDYLEGWRQKFHAEYNVYHRLGDGLFYYELELNDRNDLSLTTGDYSYSPTRHIFRGKYTGVLSRHWDLSGDLSYIASAYPVTASQDRQDDCITAAMYADYVFSRDFKLRAKAEYTDNRSTEDIFAYKQTVYTVGLSAFF